MVRCRSRTFWFHIELNKIQCKKKTFLNFTWQGWEEGKRKKRECMLL